MTWCLAKSSRGGQRTRRQGVKLGADEYTAGEHTEEKLGADEYTSEHSGEKRPSRRIIHWKERAIECINQNLNIV